MADLSSEHGSKVRKYAPTSFWLDTTADDLAPRPGVRGDIAVDVAILGGGFSGLWTAYHLLCAEPGLDVAIVEREICGFGASGRNGGWCSPRFPVDPGRLAKVAGVDRARDTMLALQRSVEDIGQMLEEEGIDAHYHRGGLLSLAIGEHQLAAVHSSKKAYERVGIGQGSRLLSAAEARSRVSIPGIAGGLWTPAGASVHPGNLVRGLARAVERRGGRIFEQTAVDAVAPDGRPALVTANGTVSARRAVVVAAEAYLPQVVGYGRSVLPMSSSIVLTAPLTDAQWATIGWAGRESIGEQSHAKIYMTRTQDGRILFGSRGAPYQLSSATPEEALGSDRMYSWMRDTVRAWFAAAGPIDFTHQWGGYLGVPRDWMPSVSFDAASRVGLLHGYTGRGVSTSHLSARLLAGLILDRPTGLEHLPLHRRSAPKWEPEPLRWLGVRYVQNAFTRIDRADEAGRRRPLDASLAEYLGEQ